jgi:hypothetical protein
MKSWVPAIALLLSACATAPTGPSVMVLPGSGKPFEQFQADDTICRQWAARQTWAQSVDASEQRRYDMSYMQCMYGKGHQIPVAGSSPPRQTPPTPAATAAMAVVPDLRGTWTGTWAQTPVTLLILNQEETPVSGIYVGPWPPLAQRAFGVSGILTFSARDEAISVNVRGWFGASDGRRTLVLDPLSGYGQQITLTRVDPDYMSGIGTSRASWEPSGPVELVRRASGVSP